MGDFSKTPLRSRNLKKDLREEIFLLIDFDFIFCSFRLASQERIMEVVMAEIVDSPNVVSI